VIGAVISSSFRHFSTSPPLTVSHLRTIYLEAYRRLSGPLVSLRRKPSLTIKWLILTRTLPTSICCWVSLSHEALCLWRTEQMMKMSETSRSQVCSTVMQGGRAIGFDNARCEWVTGRTRGRAWLPCSSDHSILNASNGVFQSLALCVVFFIGALGEELGWSGYAIDPMQNHWGALKASIILGLIWAVYHYIGLVQAHRSVEWIAWWTLYTVAARVIMVWLFNNTGKSVFGMVLFHMTLNVTWQLFPVSGSFFDPRVTGLITAVIAIIVIFLWDSQTLAQFRYASPQASHGDGSPM
jgi:hypothetical protein